MNRDEMFMVETYKCEELKKRLKPVTDWLEVKIGAKLFHNTDNNIYNDSTFMEYDKETNLVKYMVTDYSKPENEEYTLSPTGWYYYDESIANEVEEIFTPKLYIISNTRYKEDYWFVVAFNVKHLKQDFIKSMRMDDITDEEFWEKYEYEVLNKVDGFDIILK